MESRSSQNHENMLIERLFFLLTGFAVCLVCYFRNPGFLDGPNHLARYYVMTRDFQSPFFNAIYETNFRLLPNVGVDLVMFVLGRIIEPGIAFRIVLGSIVVLHSLGFYRLHRSVHASTCSPLVLLLPMTSLSYSYLLGFVNFALALGLLPWALMSILKIRDTSWWLRLVVWSTALFFCHFFAWMIFAYLTMVCLKFRSDAKLKRGEVIGLLVIFLAYIALYKLSPSSSEESKIIWSSAADKAKFFFATFVFGPYWKAASGAFFLLLTALAFSKNFRLSKDSARILGAIIVLFLVCPMGLSIGGNFDARLPAIFFAFLIALSTVRNSQRLTRSVAAAACAVTLVHLGTTGAAMFRTNAEAGHVRSIFNQVRPNSVVTVLSLNFGRATHRDTWYPNYNMLQFVGVPERPMHVQGLFSYPTQQPVLVKKGLQTALPILARDTEGKIESRQKEFDDWRANIAAKLVPFGIDSVYVFVIDHRSTAASLMTTDKVLFEDATYKLIRCDLAKG